MDQTALAGRILTPAGWVAGTPALHRPDRWRSSRGRAPEDRFIVPGFVDLHVHGGDGADCMDGRGGGAPHGPLPRPPRHHLAARDHGDRARRRPAPRLRRHRRGHGGARATAAPGSWAPISRARSSAPTRSAPSRRSRSRPTWHLLEELAAMAPIRVATYRARDRPRRRAARLPSAGWASAPRSATRPAATPRPRRAGRRCRRLHPPLQRHVAACTTASPGAVGAALAHGRVGRADPRLPPRRRGCGPAPPCARCRSLHCVTDAVAAAGMPDGEYRLGAPPDHQARRDGAPRRRQPRRQRADHGPGAAQPARAWACRSPRRPAAAAPCRPTISASRTAAGWCPVPPPTSSCSTRRAGSRRCWSRAGRSRVWLGASTGLIWSRLHDMASCGEGCG